MAKDKDSNRAKSASGCPVCSKPTKKEFRPFCSRGCADRDLLKWLGEDYRLPGEAINPIAANSNGEDEG